MRSGLIALRRAASRPIEPIENWAVPHHGMVISSLWTGNTAMNDADAFEKILTRPERGLLAQLTSPAKIQAFLDELAYNHAGAVHDRGPVSDG